MTEFILNTPNEDIYFKHASSYNNCEGTLYITNLRISWIPSGSKSHDNVIISLAEITKDQYSPSTDTRAMMRLSRISTNSAMVFLLIGSDPQSCRKELENLKLIMKRIRNNEKVIIDQTNESKPLTIDKTNKSTTNRTQKLLNENKDFLIKKNILDCNPELKKQYNELVNSNIITDDEFWKNKNQLLTEKEIVKYANSKGSLSTLLAGYKLYIKFYFIFNFIKYYTRYSSDS
jgi:hypothetical protein